MAELNTDCCAADTQASCCEPEAKADCCGEGPGCGCAAGSELQAEDIRETIRQPYLEEIEIRPTHQVHQHASAAIIRARKP
jgi:hypothetical protein